LLNRSGRSPPASNFTPNAMKYGTFVRILSLFKCGPVGRIVASADGLVDDHPRIVEIESNFGTLHAVLKPLLRLSSARITDSNQSAVNDSPLNLAQSYSSSCETTPF
jgi:hypothetical protein